MQFKNTPNTTGLTCNCTSWLDHWMNNNGSHSTPQCSVIQCTTKAVVGGRVKACDDEHSPWLIVPLCSAHNASHFTDCFDVKASVRRNPVSPNAEKLCRKK